MPIAESMSGNGRENIDNCEFVESVRNADFVEILFANVENSVLNYRWL